MNSSTERSASEAPERLTWRETGCAVALAPAEQLERPGDDPAVELLDHPGALGRLDEGGGRQQLAVVAGHPQQQLVALDAAGGEAADRLGVEAEAVVGEGVADPRASSSAPRRAPALRLAGSLEEGDPVAALLLGLVHRLVGGDQHRLGAAGVLAAEHRDPDADRHRRRPRAPAAALSATWARRSSPSCSAPSVSVCGISTANSSPERRATMSVVRTRSRRIVGDLADQVVAGVVAEAVVDRLEAVDVDDHHRALAAVAGAEGDVLVELGAEAAAVEEAGQRVVVGEVAQLGLGPLGPFAARRGRPRGPRRRACRAPPRSRGRCWLGSRSSFIKLKVVAYPAARCPIERQIWMYVRLSLTRGGE